mgnify:CR=1 FL=1
MSLFEKATRERFRFPSSRGFLTVEQLWELPLQASNNFDLDHVAKTIHNSIKSQGEESFVEPGSGSAAAKKMQEHLDVVIHVIGVKKADEAAAKAAAARRAERSRLLEVLHIRNQQELMAKSPAEIQAMLDALG